MTEWGVGSSVRRLCAPTGALLALVLVLPRPLSQRPHLIRRRCRRLRSPKPVQPTVTVVRQVPVVTPAPVVRHSTPVVKTPAQRVKPKPAPAPAKVTVKRVAKPKASKPAPVLRLPHDRNRVPLAASPRLRPRRPTRSTATYSRSRGSGCCSLRWAARSCFSPRDGSSTGALHELAAVHAAHRAPPPTRCRH